MAIKKLHEKNLSDFEVDSDRSGLQADDEVFTEFKESVYRTCRDSIHMSRVLNIGVACMRVGDEAKANNESKISDCMYRKWELSVLAIKVHSNVSASHRGQALVECEGYEIVQTKARTQSINTFGVIITVLEMAFFL